MRACGELALLRKSACDTNPEPSRAWRCGPSKAAGAPHRQTPGVMGQA
jgi:hypothetical protein